MDQNNKQLSSAGKARKKAMLTELVGQMNHIHSKRQTRTRVINTLALIIVCAITIWIVSLKYSNPQINNLATGPIIESGKPQQPSKTTLVKTINDDELIALLAKIDRPAGIIRSQGRIWLTNAVTDEELGISEDVSDEDPSSM